MNRNILAAIGLVGLGITIGIWLTSLGENIFAKNGEGIGAPNAPITVSPATQEINNQLIKASQAVLNSVVGVSVTIEDKSKGNAYHDQFKEFYKFFGEQPDEGDMGKAPKGEASGSGVIVSENGYIITNNHVVEDATEIRIVMHDKKEYKAKLVGRDPLTDLAVVKIEASGLIPVHFSDIEKVQVGEMVIAVGNPLGLNSTVTSGIVSAIGRGDLALPTKKSGYSVENFIQTDAAINPGNSGGGLFNLEGSLVGINTAIATRTGSYIGYGFAIPVDLVKAVITDLIENGKIDRGYIGVQIRTIDEVQAKSVGLDKVEGVMVNDVLKDSPAEKAGIESGDVILELDGKAVKTSNELQSRIVMRKSGDVVNVSIWRDGKKINKSVKLQAREEEKEEVSKVDGKDNKNDEADEDKGVSFDKLGFSVSQLTKEVKKSHDVKEGVYITKVDRYSVAGDRGLAPNGVIVKADRKSVTGPAQLKKIIEGKKSGDPLMLQVKYTDSNRIIAIEIP